MCRAIRVSVELLEQCSPRPVVRNRIGGGPQTIERITAIVAGYEFAPEVELLLVRVLLFVQPWSESPS